MFTWVCPTCGKELDLATKECPECGGKTAAGGPSTKPVSNVRFWALLLGGVAVAIVGLVFLARYLSRPVQRAPQTRSEPAPTASLAPLPAVPQDPLSSLKRVIEIAGIRTFYDGQNKPQVRAVIINHGEEGMQNVTLTVILRPQQAAPDSPPLARFKVNLKSELKPGDSLDVKVPLESFATLAAIPSWNQLRADLEMP